MRLIAAVSLLLLSPLASAQDWVAGVSANESSTFTYLTHFSRQRLTDRTQLVFYQTISYLSYRAREGSTSVRVNSPGIDVGAMHRWLDRNRIAGVGAGFETRWTQRGPEGGTRTTETESGPIVFGDVSQRLGRATTVNLTGRYSFANRWRIAGADLLQRVAPRLRIGPQVVYQGNEDLEVVEIGGALEIPFDGRALQIRAGQARTEDGSGVRQTEPYISAGIVASF